MRRGLVLVVYATRMEACVCYDLRKGVSSSMLQRVEGVLAARADGFRRVDALTLPTLKRAAFVVHSLLKPSWFEVRPVQGRSNPLGWGFCLANLRIRTEQCWLELPRSALQ